MSNNEVKVAVNKSPFDMDCSRFSSVSKILRVTAYVIRFIGKLRGKMIERKSVTCEELQKAETLWMKYIQRKHYQTEFTKSSKLTCLHKQLGNDVDSKGLLRCSGRLENSDLSEGAKYPLLLPSKDYITKLIIDKTHKECFHTGVSQTLARLRLKFGYQRVDLL